MKGNGIPVSGAMPRTVPRLIAAWAQTSVPIPAARRLPNGSRQRSAIESAAYPKAAYAVITAATPTRPSSSPMTARIMSVWASGR